jgi:hypothetical protein
MQEVENILRILKETKDSLKKEDSQKLKLLSDQTIHSATIYQDSDNIIVAVLVYSISKMIQRQNYKQIKGWNNFYRLLLKDLDKTISSLQKKDIESARESLGEIRNSVNEIESNLRTYIQDIFIKAGINKAFKIYEHGLSSEKTAELLGISLWDLSSYIGQSNISEQTLSGMPVKERIKIAEDFFK